MGIRKKVELIDFHPEHLVLMDIRDEETAGVMTLEDSYDRFEMMGNASIEAKTSLSDGRIIFCAGYVELWPGVIECWMIPSIHVKKAMFTFSKLLKEYVHAIIDREECHRFQTSCPDDRLHARWMKFLGLKKEGTLKQYTHHKQDYCMYARTI